MRWISGILCVFLALTLAACGRAAGSSSARPVLPDKPTEAATIAPAPAPTEPTTAPTEPTTTPTEPTTKATEPPTEPATEPMTEPVTEATTAATEPVGDVEPFEGTGLDIGDPPAPRVYSPENMVTFFLVDENGAPVSHVMGSLTLPDGGWFTELPLHGDTPDDPASGGSGQLFFPYLRKDDAGKEGTLRLSPLYYDVDLMQAYTVVIPDPPAAVTVLWRGEHPLTSLPPQDKGLRIRFVDPAGNPAKGVFIGGSPYPQETEGEIPDIAIQLGPSDNDGYISWESATPGTYALVASKDEQSQAVILIMPKDQIMADATIIWEP